MNKEQELLFEQIKEYSTILDDYINKRFKYTMNTEYLEDEIKVVSACLMETIDDFDKFSVEN